MSVDDVKTYIKTQGLDNVEGKSIYVAYKKLNARYLSDEVSMNYLNPPQRSPKASSFLLVVVEEVDPKAPKGS